MLALTNSDGRNEVEDRINLLQGIVNAGRITYIPDLQFDLRVEINGPLLAGTVYLLTEVVEHSDSITIGE